MQIGDAVVYIDEYKREYPALLTNVFDNGDPEKFPTPAVNLVYVDGDTSRTDSYGRQVSRRSSFAHISSNTAGANCWKRVGE